MKPEQRKRNVTGAVVHLMDVCKDMDAHDLIIELRHALADYNAGNKQSCAERYHSVMDRLVKRELVIMQLQAITTRRKAEDAA